MDAGFQAGYRLLSGDDLNKTLPNFGFVALSATGTTQATAAPLAASTALVTSVPSGAGVILPFSYNFIVKIINRGANALLVYPPTGAQIEAYGVNTGVSIAVGGVCEFVAATPTQFYGF